MAEEDALEGHCALLDKSMYGTRDAANNWETFSCGVLVKNGFKPGVANPCLGFNEKEDMSVLKHGDDFIFRGQRDQLYLLYKELCKDIELKMKGILGPRSDLGDTQEIRFLNRLIRWTVDGVSASGTGFPVKAEEDWSQHAIEIEADPRHVEILSLIHI